MSGWIWWVVAAFAFAVGGVSTRRISLVLSSLGALLAAIIDVAGAGGVVPWIVFGVASLSATALVRRIVRLRARAHEELRRTAALIGRQAIVLERIANDEAAGCVKIGGEVWTARAFDDEHVIERGTRVEVVDVKGATALVAD
jgi:membrane protein implicated in regulation of membrane protease activity